ncbi:MAG: 30S ribosomal protein S16 [Flavobacteriales bacterium]|nr:MAG: 30S ribosomal protein S16 [Flavobacteriales bacterium]
MSVKIRLQRHGKKGKPYYWIVAADSRSKRDGKYLDKLGFYNPNTNPATIEVDMEKSIEWLKNGAQPTKTARNILSYKGIMLKHHLLGGVAKGAFTEEEAEKRFNVWIEEKSKKVDDKQQRLNKEEEERKAKALENEKLVNEARIKAQNEAPAEEAPAEEAPAEEAPAEEAPAEEAPAEEAPAEEAPAEEAPAEEAPAEEAPAEEAPAEEAPAEEAPAEEAPAEEAPAEEDTAKEE